MTETLTNWAGNVRYRPALAVRPRSLAELRHALAQAEHAKVRASGHSFNTIADTTGASISLDRLGGTVDIDVARRIVRVPAGLRYGDVVEPLHDAGFALANLASLPHISVAGAVATGTHGSGDTVGTLSSAVAGLELMTAEGEMRTWRRGDPDFEGVVVSLGALGVVVAVELDIVPAFEVAQTVFADVPADAVLADLDAVTSRAYSTSLFTSLRDPDVFDRVWFKMRADQDAASPDELFGVRAATEDLHPLPGLPAEAATQQGGVTGPWYDRLPHFRLAFTPSAGAELQSEYFVARPHAAAAVTALRGLAPQIAPLLQISEIRTMRGDAQLLSPTGGVDAVALHFTWVDDQPAVEAVLPLLEEAFAPLDARPHWGKLFVTSPARLRELYPAMPAFLALRERLDPRGVFANDYLARLGLTAQ